MQKNDSHVFVEIDRAVCLISADTACGYGAEYECVMCRGRAAIVEDEAEKLKGLKALMKTQTGKNFEIAANAVGDACTGSNPRAIDPATMAKLFKCTYYGTEVDF